MWVGSTIGAYRIVQKIGEGGMGEVFLGEHTLLGRQAAIKVLLPEMSVQPHVERFFNEAKATTAVSDPGIVQVFDFGFTPEGVGYIVMEYLVGEPLDKRLDRLGVLPVVDALRLTRQVAGSMAAAHAAGIVHRDLKPDNLVVVRDPAAPGGERPKILDFGIAKLGDQIAGRTKTRTGSLLGTPVYMSPEQCDGRVDVDHRADIYSLGCVLFYLLTGRPPFDRPGPGPTMLAHMSEPAPAPSSVAGTLPRALDDLVLRCLAKAPADRYSSMLELQRACDEMLARAHALPSFTAASELPPAGSRRGLWIALGGFAVALAVGIGFAIAMSGGVAAHAPAASVAAPVSAPAVTLPTQAMTVTQPPAAAPSAPAAAPVPAPPPPSSAATVTRPAAPKHAQKHAPHPKPDPATDPNDDVYGDR